MLHYLKTIDGIEYYRFFPTLFKQYEACYSPEETPPYWKRPVHRVRMLIEHLTVHYQVIYMKREGKVVGHHVVARGGGRLPFSSKEDMVVGPTWITPSARGLGLGKKSYGALLRQLDLPYRSCYCFIDVTNAPSIGMVTGAGSTPLFRAKEHGLLKRMWEAKDGEYLIFRYIHDGAETAGARVPLSLHSPNGPYEAVFKRPLDFTLSLAALTVFSPLLLVLTAVGAAEMRGNPFFTQARPGREEKIFKLIKFRTMSNARDARGRLLPDDQRLNAYGKFLRSTSLDELPELLNILKGDMALIGPRPLLTEYLPWYTEAERQRHSVRPGLTGWAQVNGRNSVDWDRRLAYDLEYVKKLSLSFDLKILFLTVRSVLARSDVAEDTRAVEGNFAEIRKARQEAAAEEGAKA